MKKSEYRTKIMTVMQQRLQSILEKSQGQAARFLDKLPSVAQEALAKALGYPYVYPDLDSFVKCLMAVQLKQGKAGLIGEDIKRSRELFEQNMQAIAAKPTEVKLVDDLRLPLQNGTIFARHYHPAPNKKLPMIVFYHGGGFLVGSLDTHDEYCRLLANHANAQVLSIGYPLAPEASPLQIVKICEDALAWVHQHSKQFKILKNRIALAGDSAGGNLAAVVAQRSVNKTYAPNAQLLIYPAMDFKSRHPSYYAYKDGLVLTENDIERVTQHYAKTHNVALDDPIISPTYGQTKKLAPAYVITARHDVLHDEGSIYAHKLQKNGVKVYYQEYVDQAHGFINMTPISARAKKHVIEMSKHFRKFWDKNS